MHHYYKISNNVISRSRQKKPSMQINLFESIRIFIEIVESGSFTQAAENLQIHKPGHLLTDACLNIYTGAYYLALAFKKWGVSWEAVGAYNAGFRRTDRQAMRRLEYARKIEAIYLAIKKNKNAGQSSLTTK